jgi:predicted GTPase
MRKFLIVGRTGVGKSSFINSTFGVHVAKTSDFEACTKIVEHYARNTSLGDVCLIDTPGLAEEDEACDRAYLSMVKSKVNLHSIHATLYVSRLDETRFRPDEKRTLRLLTEQLGSTIWQRTILVFTFAGSIPYSRVEEATGRRTQQIGEYLATLTSYRFSGFQEVWQTDNVVYDWTPDGVSTLSLMTK